MKAAIFVDKIKAVHLENQMEVTFVTKKRVIIMGAAGRDFHNFNTYFRDNPNYEVVAFTATQIPVSMTRNIRLNLPANCILMGYLSILKKDFSTL